eukprot:366229-Chlamydomonas_euryale.AAC.72
MLVAPYCTVPLAAAQRSMDAAALTTPAGAPGRAAEDGNACSPGSLKSCWARYRKGPGSPACALAASAKKPCSLHARGKGEPQEQRLFFCLQRIAAGVCRVVGRLTY